MNINISRYHGPVKKCGCGLADDPTKIGQRACGFCYGRGFLAECLSCNGTGKLTVAVTPGEPSTMSSTCSPCGGIGTYGVNRPADWEETAAQLELAATA